MMLEKFIRNAIYWITIKLIYFHNLTIRIFLIPILQNKKWFSVLQSASFSPHERTFMHMKISLYKVQLKRRVNIVYFGEKHRKRKCYLKVFTVFFRIYSKLLKLCDLSQRLWFQDNLLYKLWYKAKLVHLHLPSKEFNLRKYH